MVLMSILSVRVCGLSNLTLSYRVYAFVQVYNSLQRRGTSCEHLQCSFPVPKDNDGVRNKTQEEQVENYEILGGMKGMRQIVGRQKHTHFLSTKLTPSTFMSLVQLWYIVSPQILVLCAQDSSVSFEKNIMVQELPQTTKSF